MTAARPRSLVLVLVALTAAAALVFGLVQKDDAPAARSRGQRPPLMLLTSLPLVFGEDFSIAGGGSPALKALSTAFGVLPISTTSPAELAKGQLLLMAHPQAQTAENLVALDEWVRGGGKVLLLADPLLDWPSRRPLGDPLRPSPMFMDTGLLAHWGLRLDAPDRRGLAARRLGGLQIVSASPGRLSGSCAVSSDGFVANCRIGSGRATVVADADFLNLPALPAGADRNLEGLLVELEKLESVRFG